MFGDDALKRPLCTYFKQSCTITTELIAELNATFSIGSD
jgi:hypothetical protein